MPKHANVRVRACGCVMHMSACVLICAMHMSACALVGTRMHVRACVDVDLVGRRSTLVIMDDMPVVGNGPMWCITTDKRVPGC